MRNITLLIVDDLNEKDLDESTKIILETEQVLHIPEEGVVEFSDEDALKLKNEIISDFEDLTNTVSLQLEQIEEFAHQNAIEHIPDQNADTENPSELNLQQQLHIIFENTYSNWLSLKEPRNHAIYKKYNLELKFISSDVDADGDEEQYETIEQEAVNKLYDDIYNFIIYSSEERPQHCHFKNTKVTKLNDAEKEYNVSVLLESPENINPLHLFENSKRFSVISCEKVEKQIK